MKVREIIKIIEQDGWFMVKIKKSNLSVKGNRFLYEKSNFVVGPQKDKD